LCISTLSAITSLYIGDQRGREVENPEILHVVALIRTYC